jgi:putative ABC transport system permease protein
MRGARHGGAPARRAILRWGWRLFRREWRQQILVLTLLTVAVATATFSGAFAYTFPRTQDAIFGSATQRITFNATEPQASADVEAARRYFGTIDIIATRAASAPGSATRLELRAQDPHGPYSDPMLILRQGRYPSAADEVAVTDKVADTLKATVGQQVTLDRRSRTVVGIVDNPSDFDNEFALVAPGPLTDADTVTLLVDGTRDVEAFRSQMTVPGNVNRETRPFDERAATALVSLSLTAVGLLLVALIAAAGFVVLAKRRLRQFGMLAAVGATEKQVRLVTLVNGALVGLIAALAGTALGLVVWAAALGRVKAAAGHEIDGLGAPLWLLAASMVLAVLAATASAWWPARAVARIPVVQALSARPPRPKPAHRSALVAAALVGTGLVLLYVGDGGRRPVPLLVGLPTILIGALFSAPIAIQALARLAPRLPLAGRLALRDLARYQARSGAALAAISLALGVPVGIVVVAAAEEAQAPMGNLSDQQLIFRMDGSDDPIFVPDRSGAAIAASDAEVARFAATLDGARVLSLDMAVDPDQPLDNGYGEGGGRFAAGLFWQPPSSDRAHGIPLVVATPSLLERFGAGSTAVDAHEVYFPETEGVFQLYSTKRDRAPVTDMGRIPKKEHGALPEAFISPAAARRHGWEPTRSAWLIETARPLTVAQRSAARDFAIETGMTVETKDKGASLSALRTGATAGGMLLALGVLAMTVGLIRSETAGDLRTLTATGASSGMRRKLTAATAGSLALLGVLLGVTAAYLALVGAYSHNLDALGHVPVVDLAVTALGVPVLAAAAGWLLAGHQPPAIARAALD